MSVKVEVWGDYASYNRPELKIERMSYPVMTPSAARGIMEAIMWHPGMTWKIDRIYVLSPIQYTNIRRNEVKSKVSHTKAKTAMMGKPTDLYIDAKADIVQRAATVLKNVHYVIEAHFEMNDNANETDNEGKFQSMTKRRLSKGQCYHQPYLGCREFPARFRLWEFDTVPVHSDFVGKTENLGLMLYDMDYSDPKNIQPMYFNAVLKDGVIDLTNCEVLR